MKTTVTSVYPVIDQRTQQQRTWTNNDGKINYYFHYVLANGQQGEVGHQNPQPRFPVGSEVEASDATKDPRYPKLKLEKPGGFGGSRKADDPEYQARLKSYGMVQAAIAGGAKTDAEIDAAVTLGFGAAERWKQRLMAQQPQQAPPQQQAPQQVPQPQYPQQGGYAPQGGQTPPWAQNPGAPFQQPRQPLPQNPQAGQVWQGTPPAASTGQPHIQGPGDEHAPF